MIFEFSCQKHTCTCACIDHTYPPMTIALQIAPHYSSDLVSAMNRLRTDAPGLTDIHLVAPGHAVIPCHRLVLAASSSYWQTRFAFAGIPDEVVDGIVQILVCSTTSYIFIWIACNSHIRSQCFVCLSAPDPAPTPRFRFPRTSLSLPQL